MKVVDYYDRKAEGYIKKFSRGPFGLIREKEKKSIFELLDPQIGEKILDAGCGPGFYAVKLKNLGSIPFGIDISPRMIEKIKKFGIDGEVCDLEVFRLNEKYKKILCAGALEFCENPQAALNNFNTHLEEGGIIIILYTRLSLVGMLCKIYHLFFSKISIRLFLIDDFKLMAEKAGLRIDRVGQRNLLSQAIRLKK